ncbi:hypothetical protein GTY58_15510 [Streptomyces sp. SID5469]|nr:hypothetical protein [Streptomyces sp. SID5469]
MPEDLTTDESARLRSPPVRHGCDLRNSVEVLLSRYAECIDGRQEIANRKIEELLRQYD